MTELLIHIKDQSKVDLLLQVLASLDFVDSVAKLDEVTLDEANGGNANGDFFSLAGIWSSREIDLSGIRQKAWPRQAA